MIAQLLLTAFLAQSGATAAPQAAKVSGQVVSATTGDPLKKALVTLDGDKNHFEVATGADGKFTFENLPSGEYVLQPDRMGYLESRKTTVELGPSEEKKGLTLRLTPQGIISGRVVDEDGGPIVSGRVECGRVMGADRIQRNANWDTAELNGDGSFTLAGLRAGDYLLSVTATPRDFRRADPLIERLGATWYPNAADSASASIIHLAPGGEARDVEIRMRTAHTVHVRGKVEMPADSSGVPNHVELSSGLVGPFFSARIEKGEFEFSGIPPGAYLLSSAGETGTSDYETGKYFSGPARFHARQRLDVADRDVEGVVVQLLPAIELSGVLHLENVRIEKPPVVRLGPDEYLSPRRIEAEPDEYGAFHLTMLPPTRFMVQVSNLPDDAYVQSIRYEGEKVTGWLDLTSGADSQLEITLAPKAGEIKGTLRDSDGNPVPNCGVYLWPSDSDRTNRAVTGSDGSFRIANLAPAEYHLAAWDDEGFDAEEPRARKLYEWQSVTVKVQEGSHETVDLKLITVK